MQSNLICEEFSRNIWQYIDRSLTEDEMSYWRRHVNECPLCSARLGEASQLISLYESIPLIDIEEDKFNVMIENAVRTDRKRGFHFLHHAIAAADFLPMKRFAFGGAAFVMTIMLIFLLHKPANITLVAPEARKVTLAADTAKSNIDLQDKAQVAEVRLPGRVQTLKRNRVNDWRADKVAYRINQVGRSLARIKMMDEAHREPDKWALHAIALKRQIMLLEREMNSSPM
ncbi:MAG: hypothetical protein ACM3S2_07700 [Ignavibacteriales bacterium]